MSKINAEVGEVVIRWMCDEVPMHLRVTAVTDAEIICGDYTFDRETGMEIDDFLEWGPKYGKTGSRLRTEEDVL